MWRNSKEAYGLGTIMLHWIVAALFLVQLPLGYFTVAAEFDPLRQSDLFWWHASVGFTILAISVLRIVWIVWQDQPALPDDVSPSERSAARWAHVALYLGTILVPLTGWAAISAGQPAAPGAVFTIATVPPLPIHASIYARAYWTSTHAFLAYGAGFIAAVHILAALRHHFTLKDRVMVRMLRPGRSE